MPRRNVLAPLAAATAVGIAPRAVAAVVSQSAVDQTVLLVFLAYIAVLLLLLVALIFIASAKAHRRKYMRVALTWFSMASVASAILLTSLQVVREHSLFEAASLCCAVLLAGIAIFMVTYAAIASRRSGA